DAAQSASTVAIDSWMRRIRMVWNRPLVSAEVPAGDGLLTLAGLCFFNNPPKLSDSLNPVRGPDFRARAAEQGLHLVGREPVALATELAADVGAAVDDRG